MPKLALAITLRKGAHTWRLGVLPKKTLGRSCQNKKYRSTESSCSRTPTKCPNEEVKPCAPLKPFNETIPQTSPCDPDCTEFRDPVLPPRGCLPWERGVELCPTKCKPRVLETAACEHFCEPYVGQGIIDKLKISECEWRRFKKCYQTNKDFKTKCLDLGPELGLSSKEYPMSHAIEKKFLPGCPTKLHRSVIKPKDEC